MSIDSHRVRLGLALAASGLLLAACGGSPGSTATHSSGASPRTAGATSHAATVRTRSGALGTFLTDGSGRTLYLFAADHGSTSTCTGGCASAWPPFTTHGKPTAAGQARAGMLGTTGGRTGQVTYGGHPLYYFAADSSAKDAKGEGVDGFGARWWVVSPGGDAIMHDGPASKPSGGSGGSGGAYG